MKINLPAGLRSTKHQDLPNIDRKPQAKCLRNIHKCHNIGDLVKQASYSKDTHHNPNKKQCSCRNCTHLRTSSCRYPKGCYQMADKILTALPPHHDPYDSNDHPPYPWEDLLIGIKKHAIGDPENISIFTTTEQISTDLYCNVCTPQAESTPRNPEAGSAYRLSPQSLVSKEARIKLWGITTHIQAKGSMFP